MSDKFPAQNYMSKLTGEDSAERRSTVEAAKEFVEMMPKAADFTNAVAFQAERKKFVQNLCTSVFEGKIDKEAFKEFVRMTNTYEDAQACALASRQAAGAAPLPHTQSYYKNPPGLLQDKMPMIEDFESIPAEHDAAGNITYPGKSANKQYKEARMRYINKLNADVQSGKIDQTAFTEFVKRLDKPSQRAARAAPAPAPAPETGITAAMEALLAMLPPDKAAAWRDNYYKTH